MKCDSCSGRGTVGGKFTALRSCSDCGGFGFHYESNSCSLDVKVDPFFVSQSEALAQEKEQHRKRKKRERNPIARMLKLHRRRYALIRSQMPRHLRAKRRLSG